MPFAEISGGRLHYQFDGKTDARVLMLSNSLGTDLSMWQRQVAALSLKFRVLRYDCRGQGRSLVTDGPYSIELLARDARHSRSTRDSRVHFCGLSLGGMVGMWLAAHEPAHVDKLVLANTTALYLARDWDARIKSVQEGGITAIVDGVMERWFTPAFGKTGHSLSKLPEALLATSPDGYIACVAALRDMDLRAELRSIRSRTFVIAGNLIQQLRRRWVARSMTRLTEPALLNFWLPICRTRSSRSV